MSEFYKTDIGKIINHGIHESNTAIGHMNNAKWWLTDFSHDLPGGLPLEERVEKAVRFIENAIEKQKKSMDYVYEKLKEL